MGKKRVSHTTAKKLEIIKCAQDNKNIAEAARQFNVDESNIRRWMKQKNVLEKLNPKKRSMRKGKPKWIQLEKKLKEYVLNLRKQNFQVSTVDIKYKAKQYAKEDGINDFVGTNYWVFKFMKRNNLSVRSTTSIGQHLPEDWEAKAAKFLNFLNDNKNDVELDQIGNMDEVPCTFDIPRNRTVDEVGKEDISIVTTGHEKMNFTIVLCVTANGFKCKPMVIFKRKTLPKENFIKGIVVAVNPKGWMDSGMMKFWLENVWRKRPKSFFKPKSILVFDSARSHLTEEVKKEVKKHSQIAVIPGGLTKKLQPLDLTVNKPFKDHMKKHWDNWMKEGEHHFTKSNKMKRASYSEVCKWIVESWKKIDEITVKKGFQVSKICDYEGAMETDSETEIEDNCDKENCDIDCCDEVDFDDVNNDRIDLSEDFNEKCSIDFVSDDEFDGFD